MSLSCPSLLAKYAPDFCRSVDLYCERTSPAMDAEPLNAISNAAFLIAAACVWRLAVRGALEFKTTLTSLAAIIAFVGLGSFAFHTIGTKWAEWADVIPILIFMVVYLWTILAVFFRWSPLAKVAGVAVFFGVTYLLTLEDTVTAIAGPLTGIVTAISAEAQLSTFTITLVQKVAEGAMYLPTLLLMLIVGLALFARGSTAALPFFGAATVFVLSFTARTLDGPLCASLPIGTHYFWHILNAVVLYLLAGVVARHARSA